MDKLIVLLLIFVLHYSVVSAGCIFNIEQWDFECDDINDRQPQNPCPNNQSQLSTIDIQALIEHIVKDLRVKETIENNYTEKAIQVRNKYLKEVNDYQERIAHRPEHIKHIVEDMASIRLRIQPMVNDIVARLNEIDAQDNKFNILSKRTKLMLEQVDMYKKICKMNCETPKFENQLLHSESKINLMDQSSYSCWHLKELYNVIKGKLNQFTNVFSSEILNIIEENDDIYEQKVTMYKNNLKNAALKQFGPIMYDILSLQDDYHHFIEGLNETQIGQPWEEIKANNLNIEQHLLTLEIDVDLYRVQCMNCPIKVAVKTRLPIITLYNIDYEVKRDVNMKQIDDLIESKIKEIQEVIYKNFTNINKELDARLNDDNIENTHANIIVPSAEIVEIIKLEQQAFETLKNAIPQASSNKLTLLLQNSSDLLVALNNIKEFLDTTMENPSKI